MDQQFRFKVEQTSSIPGRGTLVSGKVENGLVHAGQPVEIVRDFGKNPRSKISAVAIAGKAVEEARAGDSCGLLLTGVKESDVGPGTVLRSAEA